MTRTRERRRQGPTDPVTQELVAIKRLLMLQLVNDGVEARDIAIVLGIAQSKVSETIPVRRLSTWKKEG